MMHAFWRERGLLLALMSLMAAFLVGEGFFIQVTSHVVLAVAFFWLFSVIVIASLGVVRHAEVLARRFGEPFGTLILTISVTCIEVIMIAAVMTHEEVEPTTARNTVYFVLMIIINGLIGLAMLLGGIKYGEQRYNLKSSNSYFSMLLAIVGVSLFLPNFIPAPAKQFYDIFLIVISLMLYCAFLRIQMVEHRNFFDFETEQPTVRTSSRPIGKGVKGGRYHALILIATLACISLLAENLAIVMDEGVDLLRVPHEMVALLIAVLILAPEGMTAIRAGLDNQMQRVVNIGLGSALATISLTIPAMLVISLLHGQPITLGLTPIQGVMLGFSLLIGMNNYKDGETNLLQGAIHFVLFVTFIVLIFI